jgi:redox-sensitive bicupin YhaK (pirin superfamily)
MGNIGIIEKANTATDRLGKVVSGMPHVIGNGFTANHFSEEMFGGSMDPLLMVDHFVMTAPTFDPHMHAGISAVTAMFEDSVGNFLNRDSLGNKVTLKGGDLYWLAAANGAAHEEKPEDGARIHALQIFVNLPARLKHCPARALHVEAGDIPILQDDGYRVRLVLGQSGTTNGTGGTPEEMTMLDGMLAANGTFVHPLTGGRQAWVYAVSGKLTVRAGEATRVLAAGTATTIEAGSEIAIALEASEPTHFVLMAARPIHEPFVKAGPLVMSTAAEVRETLASYAKGEFGRIVS